ncbi:MAG: aminodeoxychorismate synthase component I [Planctomycetota bacterium]
MPATALVTFAHEREPAILESVAGDPTYGRWSILACQPVDVLVVEPGRPGDPFAAIAAELARYPTLENLTGLPFSGGWIGYISYEAGARTEKVLPTKPAGTSLPLVRFALYDTAALFDHLAGRWHLIAVDWPRETGLDRPNAPERLAQLRERLLQGGPPVQRWGTRIPPSSPPPSLARCVRWPTFSKVGYSPDWTREEYLARVRRAKEYIAAGDIYQVNLTQRFVVRTDATPLQLYLALRRANPADYAALLAWGEQAIVSSSPELFLDLHGGRVLTRPIKGTRPRTGDTRLDALRRRELADSEKDRAELNMIIDLLRNDLARVCAVGSVRVESAGDLETHPTVFHRVATITGRLRPELGAVDLLRATCPGGSITGAPKIRAMQIIDELEAVQRGVYCGSIGYLGLDGNIAMNIAIRTMILDRGRVHVHAGGAIVADSDPDEEYEETLAKAAGMFRALGFCTGSATSRAPV